MYASRKAAWCVPPWGVNWPLTKALVVLAVRVGVCDGHLDVLSGQVHDGVAQLAVQTVFEKVFQAILAAELFPVEVQGQACVEVGVVPEQLLHVLCAEAVRLENLRVGLEADACSVALGGGFHLGVVDQFTKLEARALDLAFTHALHHEFCAQGIHRFGAHAIQTHRLLERSAVVLPSCVDFGHTIHNLPQGNARDRNLEREPRRP